MYVLDKNLPLGQEFSNHDTQKIHIGCQLPVLKKKKIDRINPLRLLNKLDWVHLDNGLTTAEHLVYYDRLEFKYQGHTFELYQKWSLVYLQEKIDVIYDDDYSVLGHPIELKEGWGSLNVTLVGVFNRFIPYLTPGGQLRLEEDIDTETQFLKEYPSQARHLTSIPREHDVVVYHITQSGEPLCEPKLMTLDGLSDYKPSVLSFDNYVYVGGFNFTNTWSWVEDEVEQNKYLLVKDKKGLELTDPFPLGGEIVQADALKEYRLFTYRKNPDLLKEFGGVYLLYKQIKGVS